MLKSQLLPPGIVNPANVTITGGTINGTVIGGTNPAAGTFTTVTATSANTAYKINSSNALSYPTNDTTTGGSIAIGTSAQANLPASAAYGNTTIGYQTLSGASVTTAAIRNTSLGFQTLKAVTGGVRNTTVGWTAGTAITTGDSIVAVGDSALKSIAGGSYSTGIGQASLQNCTGNFNTAVGQASGASVTNGVSNTIMGQNVASTTLQTGSSNILIGCSNAIDTASSSTSNYLAIGNSSTPVISATGINGVPVITMGGATTATTLNTTSANTWSKAQRGAVSTLTDAATVAIDLSLANNYNLTLGGSRTLGVPTNPGAGQTGFITVRQDITGSRMLVYAWPYVFASGSAPTLSTAKLAMDQLYYTVNSYSTSTVTVTIASPAVMTWTAHGFSSGMRIQLTTTGALPTGLSANTTYWVTVIDANTFNLSTSLANAQAATFITTTGSQSGVHTGVDFSITISSNLGLA